MILVRFEQKSFQFILRKTLQGRKLAEMIKECYSQQLGANEIFLDKRKFPLRMQSSNDSLWIPYIILHFVFLHIPHSLVGITSSWFCCVFAALNDELLRNQPICLLCDNNSSRITSTGYPCPLHSPGPSQISLLTMWTRWTLLTLMLFCEESKGRVFTFHRDFTFRT